MATGIDELAIVDSSAKIGSDVAIGPFSVIGPNVIIGEGCVIGSGVKIACSKIGERCTVGANTVIGGDPQVIDWKAVQSCVTIGSRVTIGELTVIHRSMYEHGETSIGDDSYIMAQVHIGHDCKIDEGVVVTTLAGLSGHVDAGKHSVIGGAVGIHQFVRIGTMAMVGGLSRLVQDVPPYFTVAGVPAVAKGLNSYALKKHKISPAERVSLKKAYKLLVRSHMPMSEAILRITEEMPMEGVIATLVEFIKGSKRGMTL